ncbi:MAG: ATP-grasp domain-containing protein [Opitutaceae bacterium]|nr:ATP-grasp domain-containing protein [Opitutaceae bacterium]
MSSCLLVTSAGRRNQLLQCFRDSARTLNVQLRVLAADLQPELSPACQQADVSFHVPRCTSVDYIPALLDLCRRQQVHVLVPTIDPELAILSRHIDDFASIGTRIVISSPAVVALGNDKWLTSVRLANAGIPTPKTVTLAEYRANPESLVGAVIAKPNTGSASVGIVRPQTLANLAGLSESNYIVQEMWQGVEYTVNMFFDRQGILRCMVPHRRLEVRSGEVSKGRTDRVPQLMQVAEKLGNALSGARGPLCFQAIVQQDGVFCVFEINARFGGGYPLAHEAGAPFTQWLLEEHLGRELSAHNNWTNGLTMLRYDSAVYLNA